MHKRATDAIPVLICDAELGGTHAARLRESLNGPGRRVRPGEWGCAIVCVDARSWGEHTVHAELLNALDKMSEETPIIPLIVSTDSFPTDLPDVLWRRQALVVDDPCDPLALLELEKAISSFGSPQVPDHEFVFLCYNARDREHVRVLDVELRAAGMHTWYDRRDLLPGGIWEAAIGESLTSATTLVVCVGRDGLSEWQLREIDQFRTHEDAAGRELIHVLLPSIDEQTPLDGVPDDAWNWKPGSSLLGFPHHCTVNRQ